MLSGCSGAAAATRRPSGALAGVLLFHCVRLPLGEIVVVVMPVRNDVMGAAFVLFNGIGLLTADPAERGGIAYGAHLGGALFGAACAPFFRGRAPPLRFRM